MAEIKDINLLPYEERVQERFIHLQRRLTLASVIFLSLAAVFTLVTLIFFTSLSTKRAGLLEDIEISSREINNNKAAEELLVVISSKISTADKILSSRADYPEIFAAFAALIPRDVYFSDIKIAANKIVASGKARTSADVAGLVSSLLSENGAKIVTNLAVESLNSDENGQYSFVISAELAGKQ